MVSLDSLADLVNRVHQVLKERLAHQETVSLDLLEVMDLLGILGHQAYQVCQGRLALMGYLVNKDKQDLMGLMDYKAIQVNREIPEHRVHKVILASQV